MDKIQVIILITLIIAIIVIIAYLILTKYFKINFKGLLGEKKTKKILEKNQKYNTCYIINDFKAYNKGKSIQIDHILLTPSKILCIETKNYQGTIYGKHNDLNWTVKYTPKEKKQIYNPIKQNANHVKFLYDILGNKQQIENIVVFVGTANIERINDNEEVYTKYQLKKYIEELSTIERYDYYKAYETLLNRKENISNKEHYKNIQKYIE